MMAAARRTRGWPGGVVRACLLACGLIAIATPVAADRKSQQDTAVKELSDLAKAAQAKAGKAPAAKVTTTKTTAGKPKAAKARPAQSTGGKLTSLKATAGRDANAQAADQQPAAAKPVVITPDDAAQPAQPAAGLGPGVELITGGSSADGAARVGRLPIIQ